MMFSWLRQPSLSIAGGALVIGALSLASRLVGLLRDRLLAGTFGAGDTLDVYYAAFRIPDTIFALLIIGALSASFIPVFSSFNRADVLDSEQAWRFTNRILNLLTGGFLLLALLGFVFAHPLATVIAPGFSSAKQEAVVTFMRVMFFAQALLAASTVYGSVLQATKHFFLFSLAPVLYNIGIMLGVLILAPMMGAIGLAWGVVLGALLHVGISYFGVRALGYRYAPILSFFDSSVRDAARLMLPRMLGVGIGQLQFILLSILASRLASGSVAAFQFAYNLEYFPIGLLGVSYAIAVFPSLAAAAEAKDTEKFSRAFSTTVRQMLFFIIPATIVFLLLRAQIVRVVLGAGTFGWDETILVADTLAFFAMSFFAQALSLLLVRGCFAYRDSVTPLVAGVISALVLFGGSRALAPAYGVVGLAMAFSLASIVQMAILWAALRIRTGNLGESAILSSLLRMTVAGVGAGLVIQFAKPLTLPLFGLSTFFGVLAQGLFAGGLGLLTYGGLSYALQSEELRDLLGSLNRQIFRRARPTEVAAETSLS